LQCCSVFEEEPILVCTESVLEAKTGLSFVSVEQKSEAKCLIIFVREGFFIYSLEDVTGTFSQIMNINAIFLLGVFFILDCINRSHS